MASELQEALTSIVGLHRHAACFLALLAQSCQSIHATAGARVGHPGARAQG